MLTLFKLFVEAIQYAHSDKNSSWSIFRTLISLYVRSKFSNKKTDLVQHKIGSYTFYSYTYPVFIELYREIFLKEVYKTELNFHTPFIIDCGANIGFSVLYFKQQYPNAEIWAFEPNPHSFSLLEKNIRENNLQHVRLFNCAVSNVEGLTTFYAPQNKSSLNGSSAQTNLASDKITVQSKKLSKMLTDRKVDLIKIDIEGDETKVIQELDEANLLTVVEEFIIEYHYDTLTENANKVFFDFLKRFENNGFTYTLHSVEDAGAGKENRMIGFKCS